MSEDISFYPPSPGTPLLWPSLSPLYKPWASLESWRLCPGSSFGWEVLAADVKGMYA